MMRDEALGLVVCRGHRRLPNLALVLLAVAHQHPGAQVAALEPRAKAGAEAERQPHAERSSGVLDAGRRASDGVPLQPRALLPEGLELVDGEVPGLGHHGVLHRRAVALAHDEAVAIGPVGTRGVVSQEARIEHAHDVGRRHGPTDVPGLGSVDHAHDVATNALRHRLEVGARLNHY